MGPGDSDIRGGYTATHEIMLAIGTFGTSAECPGSVTISSLAGNQFMGQVSIEETTAEDACEPGTAPFSGTVSSSGAVVVPFTPEDLDALAELFAGIGCVVVDSDEALAGTFDGDTITVAFSADLECEDVEGQVTFTYRIEATRIS